MRNLDKEDFLTETRPLESENKNSSSSKILVKHEFEMDAVNDTELELIIKEERINDVRYLNKFFEAINGALKNGGIFRGNVETYTVRRTRLLKKNPAPFN